MTATPPPAGRRLSWRARWAERENDRRRRAHAGEAEAWRRRADELTRLRIEATCFLDRSLPPDALPVRLRHGEVVYRVLTAVELVEVTARQAADLPAPGLAVDPTGSEAPRRPLPRGIRVVDSGTAVVTDRRVAFLGRHRQRIWWYTDLAGPAHHPRAPLTLLHTNDGSSLAGVLAPPPAALHLRFYLTLAFADGLGNRDAVAACLDDLVAAHQRGRPPAPPAAAPAQAPVLARLHDRRLARAAAAFAAVLAVVGVVRANPALTPIPFTPAGKPRPVVITDVTVPGDGRPTTSRGPRPTFPPSRTAPATSSAAATAPATPSAAANDPSWGGTGHPGGTGYPELTVPGGTTPPGGPAPGITVPPGGATPGDTGLPNGPAPGSTAAVLPDTSSCPPVPPPIASPPPQPGSAWGGGATIR